MRMPRKNNSRRLWLNLRYMDTGSASRKKVIETMLRSIDNGDYRYPTSWRVAIGWSNKENGALRWGEWTKEMTQSAQSSEGFDIAVRQYLESQL